LRPAGYSAGEVGRALGGGVQSKGAAQNAAAKLGDALESAAVRPLFVRSKTGGRGAKPWALREATTDVALAAAAVADGRWMDAATLTQGGTAELVGIPCPVVKQEDWRELPPMTPRSLPPSSLGALPFELFDSAEHSKRRVRAHRDEWQPSASPTAERSSTDERPAPWRSAQDEPADRGTAVTQDESLQDLLELTHGTLTLLLPPHAGEPPHTITVTTVPPPEKPPVRGRHVLRWASAAAAALAIVVAATLSLSGEAHVAKRSVLTIDNRVAIGHDTLKEDTQPVVLTSHPYANCGPRDCNIGETERGSGDVYDAAVCQIQGDAMTNGNDTATGGADDDNRGRISSLRYYGVRLRNGKTGYVSEVWVRERGGQSLPTCGADFTPSRPRPGRSPS
jgi:hypothetical protein